MVQVRLFTSRPLRVLLLHAVSAARTVLALKVHVFVPRRDVAKAASVMARQIAARHAVVVKRLAAVQKPKEPAARAKLPKEPAAQATLLRKLAV